MGYIRRLQFLECSARKTYLSLLGQRCFRQGRPGVLFIVWRSGAGVPESEHPRYFGSDVASNSTDELEGIGHALAWASKLESHVEGELLMVADSFV